DAGEVLAVIGPNGAGKTTLFKVLTGEVDLQGGRVTFDGRDITSMPAHQRVRLGSGRTFQVARVFPEMTALENVVVAIESVSAAGPAPRFRLGWWPRREVQDLAMQHLAEVGLAEKSAMHAGTLSHGDKKRLELACCLALKPRILMLDEPTAGMSPGDRRQAVELIMRIKRDHDLSIMLTEHDMGVVFGMADRILVLNYGELVAEGTVDEVRANEKVREIYLGSGALHA
ncbi:MAG: ABC transporter ATP-binding protein, partial [Rhodobacterales bacterium]|nr:ABC transporter ATP-binding protein [Rhodobacterales bacterium]